ncbi:unnamed protein product [Adineta steineri]|uniref:Uncharacterized protein n=1 Tax=Adineta steineri TaxID=433720 RepID=A0A818JUC4_9BILA|nr:unnamed protein product [Adineta steineri]CAF3544309.1 unnamed protein product [Adineta steineri]
MHISYLANAPRDLAEHKTENERLVEEWQDWILGNVMGINYLNSLMVHASKQDFAFTIPDGYLIRYVQNKTSFRETVSQLATETKHAFSGAREDLNRVHTGLQRVPEKLKTMVLLMKQAPFELLLMLFPDSFNDIEKLTNDSLVVLRKPEKSFEQVLNLLTEIDHLLTTTQTDQMISLQVSDIKIQWTYLTLMIKELSKRAEVTRNKFIFQFNFILERILDPNVGFTDESRDLIIKILLPVIIEIDQTSDILETITKVYTDMSFLYTDEELGGNGHLILLEKEEDRKRYLKQFQYGLLKQVIQIARLASERHSGFIRRDKNRKANYEKFLAETSPDDLMSLLG